MSAPAWMDRELWELLGTPRVHYTHAVVAVLCAAICLLGIWAGSSSRRWLVLLIMPALIGLIALAAAVDRRTLDDFMYLPWYPRRTYAVCVLDYSYLAAACLAMASLAAAWRPAWEPSVASYCARGIGAV